MTPQELIANFGTLADAPGGTERIRAIVLTLAIQGKLVPQQTRQNLVLRFDGDGAQPEQELPFELPHTWIWRRVDQAGEVKLGRQRTPQNHVGPHMRPYLRVANVFEDRIDTSDVLQMNFDPEEAERFLLMPNDILLNEGQSHELVGRPAIYRGEIPGACFQNTLIRFRPYSDVLPEFALIVFRAYMRTGRFRREAQQTTNIAHLSVGRFAAIEFPLPSLHEQKRIITKVDQLMSLCDELEARQTKKRETKTKLTRAALDALTDAEGPKEFEAAWRRVADHFEVLFDKLESVGDLRKAILELAARGRLVKRDPGDEPVAILLERVSSERVRMMRERSIRNTDVLLPVQDNEAPELPSHWSWERLGNLADVVGGITKGRALRGRNVASHPYLRVANVQRGSLDLRVVKEIEIPVEDLEKYQLHRGDVLFTEGGDWDKLGRSVVWEEQINPCLHQNHIFRARLWIEGLNPYWFSLYANSPVGRRYFEQASKRTTNLASINMTQLRNCPVPVPPSGEQMRIMKKVEQLMALCDRLEAKLQRTEDVSEKFAESATAAMVA